MTLLKRAAALLPLVLAVLAVVTTVYGQAPNGSISGTVTDQSGAVVPNATVTVTDRGTASARNLTANAEGFFSAPSLPAGEYEVKAEVQGFKTLVRDAQVAAGGATTVDMALTLGQASDVVNVEAAAAQVNYESHAVAGVVARESIQELPINGRSFLSLASLEPGITTTPGTPAQFNALIYVSTLGGIGYTRFTLDGGIVNDEWEGNGQTGMNFSTEIVQEFQMSTVNFDPSAGIATGGQVNVVTRSGGNEFHGSGYFFFRDHNMSAFPGLKRPTDPTNLNVNCKTNAQSPTCLSLQNPYFGRRNPGFVIGGPIKRNKMFFFTNYEYMNQDQVYVLNQDLPSLAPLAGSPVSPYHNTLFTTRFDYTINDKNTLFARYSHDGNLGFGPYGGTQPLESSWSSNRNWSDQSIIGLTTVVTPNVVNNLILQYHYWQNDVEVASASQCPAPCPGQGLPSIVAGMVGSSTFYGGVSDNSPQPRQGRVYEIVDNLSWQKGQHRIRAGADYERIVTKNTWDFCVDGCLGLYSTETTLATANPAVLAATGYTPPATIATTQDLLNLPVFNTSSSIYSGIDVGDGKFPGPYDRGDFNHNNRPKFYVNDTWKVTQNLTVNGSLGYEFETGLYYNLPFPAFLTPIIGNNLAPIGTDYLHFAPQVGFAYALGRDKKTVIRGGAGLYWDSEPLWHHFRAGATLGPVGNGRTTLTAGSLTNIFPGIVNLTNGAPLAVGAPLPLNTLTNMTLGQFIQIYNQQLPLLTQELAPTPPSSGPFTVSGIDVAKTAVELHPPNFAIMRSYQTSIGVQRELGHQMVLQADYARRQFENVDLGELDLNRSARTIPGTGIANPVIPTCTAAQVFVPGQECSTGSVTFWVPQGRAIYEGLLVKLTQRPFHHFSYTLSYALQNEDTVNAPTYDLNNYFTTYGPNLARHQLNLAGLGDLPWGFKLSVNQAIYSRTPVEPLVAGYDLFASGLAVPLNVAVAAYGDTEAANKYNCFGITCGKGEMASEIAYWNANIAGTKDLRGTLIKPLSIPSDYQFGDPKFDIDMRLTKQFVLKERYKMDVFVEGFNVLNMANLVSYSFTVSPATFGQPTARYNQVFGSGGPRAFEVGGRFSF